MSYAICCVAIEREFVAATKKSDIARQLFVSFMYFLPSLKILLRSNNFTFTESKCLLIYFTTKCCKVDILTFQS